MYNLAAIYLSFIKLLSITGKWEAETVQNERGERVDSTASNMITGMRAKQENAFQFDV